MTFELDKTIEAQRSALAQSRNLTLQEIITEALTDYLSRQADLRHEIRTIINDHRRLLDELAKH